MSNVATLAIGYGLFLLRQRIARFKGAFSGAFGYWCTFVFLLFDPVNLSIAPFIFGGDIGGIVAGFGVGRTWVQAVAFGVLLVNRELVIHKLFPLFDVESRHPLFRSLLNKRTVATPTGGGTGRGA